MRKRLGRLLIITILSMIGLLFNQWYFISTNPEEELNISLSKIAIVIVSDDESERKHGNSDIWHPLKTGDSLYINDTLRTAAKSALQFQFTGTDKIINVEPESLLVLQQTAGKINLDLLDGKLLVKKSDKADSPMGAKPTDNSNTHVITIAGESLDNEALLTAEQDPQSLSGLNIKIVEPKDFEKFITIRREMTFFV